MPTPTTSKAYRPTPREAAILAKHITRTETGHAMHKSFDKLSNQILRGLGFGDFVDAFERATAGYHDGVIPTDTLKGETA